MNEPREERLHEQLRPGPRWLHDRFWEREQQLATQRKLLERLRYKQYQRHGTLASFMQRLGDFGRKYFGGIQVLRLWLR